jgi:hypothetical protein
MTPSRALTLLDIPWLRLASHKNGAPAVPQGIAKKLIAGGLVELDSARDCLTITNRGRLALERLG